MPAKSRGRKHAAEGSAASSPNNCPHGKLAKAEAASSEDEAAPPGDAFQAAQQQLGPAGGAPHPEAGIAHTLAITINSAWGHSMMMMVKGSWQSLYALEA